LFHIADAHLALSFRKNGIFYDVMIKLAILSEK